MLLIGQVGWGLGTDIRLHDVEFTDYFKLSSFRNLGMKKLWSDLKRDNEMNWRSEIMDNNKNHQYCHNILQLLQVTLKKVFMFIVFWTDISYQIFWQILLLNIS